MIQVAFIFQQKHTKERNIYENKDLEAVINCPYGSQALECIPKCIQPGVGQCACTPKTTLFKTFLIRIAVTIAAPEMEWVKRYA